MNKKRIVMVSGHSPYDGRIFHKEAKSLRSMGYDVTIVGWDFKGDGIAKTEDGITLNFRPFRLDRKKNVFANARFFKKKVMPVIQREILACKPDLIHCHDLETLPVGVKAAKRMRCRLVYDCHEYWPEMEYHQNRLWGIFTYFLERWNIMNVDGVITVSDHLAERFAKRKIPTVVLYNTTRYDTARDILANDKKVIRDELGLPKNKFIVGYVGAMNYRMDFASYVKALAMVDESVVMVFVGGDGGSFKPLGALAEELDIGKNLILVPRVKYGKCLKYIYSFDIGLQALLSDPMAEHTLPTKIFEYMALKIPYIAPDLRDMAEFTKKWKSGYILDDRSPGGISKIISKAVSDPVRNAKIGERGYLNVKERFSWERMEKRLQQFYEKMFA